MNTRTTMLFRNATRYAAATIGTIAEEAGYSRIMIDQYLNRAAPSRPAALALADALEARAARLSDYAGKLREATDDAGGPDGAL